MRARKTQRGSSSTGSGAPRERAGPARSCAIAFLVSLALLDAQVAVTRLIAYRFFYHFVFFVVSLAQLGLAAAGAWVYAARRSPVEREELVRWLLGLAALPLVVLGCYSWLGPEPNLSFAKVDGASAPGYLGLLALGLVALNFCGGMALTLLLTRFRERVGAIYAADLAGASLGCAASVGLMAIAGPIRAFLGAGLAAVAAALLLASNRGGFSAAAALALLLGAGWLRPELFDPYVLQPQHAERILRSEWNHLARTDAARAGRYVIDGDASTDVLDGGPSAPAPEYALVRDSPDVAILGVGAGPQLRDALAHRAASVLAVDLNPTIVRWSLDDDRSANAGIFRDPRVDVRVGEGRHLLRSSARDFDLIVMHAIDTWTASAQGAYSLSENFLYTSEAMSDLLSRLRPGGVVSIRRWLFWPPRETLRLFTTVLDALERGGFERPEAHVAVVSPQADFRNPSLQVWGFLLFSNRPFDASQLAALDRYVDTRGWAYLYRPGRALDTPFTEYARSADRAAFLAAYPYIVTPARDSNPFFFQFAPPWSAWSTGHASARAIYAPSSTLLLLCLAITSALALLLLGIPLYLRRADLRGERTLAPSLLYFASLGLGFMAFELPVIQIMTLFLGHPTYALSVVLAGLLAGAGLGSTWMGRAGARAGAIAGLCVVALALGSALALLPAVHALIQLALPARMALTLAYVIGIGIPLGMPLVAGLRLLDRDRPQQIAWSWAVNGAAAVVGSCLVMILMVYSGSGAAFAVAASSYSASLLARGALVRAQREVAAPGEPVRWKATPARS